MILSIVPICVYSCVYIELGYLHLQSVNTSIANGRCGNTRTCYIGDGWFPTLQLIVEYPTDAAQSKAINSEMYEHTKNNSVRIRDCYNRV